MGAAGWHVTMAWLIGCARRSVSRADRALAVKTLRRCGADPVGASPHLPFARVKLVRGRGGCGEGGGSSIRHIYPGMGLKHLHLSLHPYRHARR